MFSRKINPAFTQRLHKYINSKSGEGAYRIYFEKMGVVVDVFPGVFPPDSDVTLSSEIVHSSLDDLSGKEVLDIGTGTGIEAIFAARMGAKKVDAIDITDQALDCAKHNVAINNLSDKVAVFKSDIFSNIKDKKYDLIIANLPIVDFNLKRDSIDISLYDHKMRLHKNLFKNLHKYLKNEGYLLIPHTNLQSKNTAKPDSDFTNFELLLKKYHLRICDKLVCNKFGHKWINYKISI